MELEPTNPEEQEVEAIEETHDEVETPDEPELDEYGNPVEDEEESEPEPEYEEIEYNGKTYKVEKDLKDGFLMQSDYTRKTQELAEQRKAFEAQREEWSKLSETELKAQADVTSIDQALSEFQQIDWNRWQEQDPAAAQRAFTQYQLLKDERQQALNTFQQARQERTLQEQRESAERLQKGTAQLAKEIPGWGQEKATELLNFGQQLGFDQQELMQIDDPRMVIALYHAQQGFKSQAKQKTAAKVEAQQAVKPAAKVKGGKTPVANKLDDRVSTDAWMKARMNQVTKS